MTTRAERVVATAVGVAATGTAAGLRSAWLQRRAPRGRAAAPSATPGASPPAQPLHTPRAGQEPKEVMENKCNHRRTRTRVVQQSQ
ncbi:hypothetical protein JYU34_003488 [Plutella xylostella]|uniref:Secreted protein n=1 Tax=Plutella xylostella TaxID=51655 RepID=A0ABQ7R073_PLUXY|nr:hypothetical protein JYU34_003488 [Plutella xylostella]